MVYKFPWISLSVVVLFTLITACSSDTENIPSVGAGSPGGAGSGDPAKAEFISENLVFEPVPENRVVGVDNYIPEGSKIHGANEFHLSGQDCLRCHAEGGKADTIPFTMAGTIWKDRLASEPLAGAEVVFYDISGEVVSMTTNAAGNFMTQRDIAKDEEGRLMFKSWVLGPDGRVQPMRLLTGVSCNTHHGPFGQKGPIWAGSLSPLAEVPAGDVSFREHLLPIFESTCNTCHGPRRPDDARFAYLALTSYAGLMRADRTDLPDFRPVINTTPGDEAESLLLVKMLGPEITHGGGKIAIDENDTSYRTILRWIQQGAKNN